ncbi:Uncharacterised protein r2_g3721 [Pycnogonum litorale]
MGLQFVMTLTSAALILPSEPLIKFFIIPSFHVLRCLTSPCTSTTSPTCSVTLDYSVCHIILILGDTHYSILTKNDSLPEPNISFSLLLPTVFSIQIQDLDYRPFDLVD